MKKNRHENVLGRASWPPFQTYKPYHTPVLEVLGTARELTLGTATTGPPDVKGGGRRGA